MKRMITRFCLVAAFVFAGCGGDASSPAMNAAEAEPAPVIELTAEEEAILEVAAPEDQAEPVTRENYEEALEDLEEALNAEQ